MQAQRDRIKEGVRRILDIACNDPDREVKAVRIAEEMVFRIVATRREPTSGKLRPKQSITRAATYYNTPDRAEWIAGMEKRYSGDQTQFVGMISIWYSTVMQGLTKLQAKIVDIILAHYYRGAASSEIARSGIEDLNTVTSILSRLVKAGLVQARKNGEDKRRTNYYVSDVNWLRVHALHSHAFRKWLRDDKGSAEDVIDRFIVWCVEDDNDNS